MGSCCCTAVCVCGGAHASRCAAAALIVDYGVKAPFALSLRGIQGHKFVHPLSEPGFVDLVCGVRAGGPMRRRRAHRLGRPVLVVRQSVDADFTALREAAGTCRGVAVR